MKSRIIAVVAAAALSLGLSANPAGADPVDDLMALLDTAGDDHICVEVQTVRIPNPTGIHEVCVWIGP